VELFHHLKVSLGVPITLTKLLEIEGLDLSKIRLVRHHKSNTRERSPWDLWQRQDGSFELYQRIQNPRKFDRASLLLSFVMTPDKRTLFVGAYEVAGKSTVPKGMRCPLSGKDSAGRDLYDLRPSHVLKSYSGRLVIDWGPPTQQWVHLVHTDEEKAKQITELWRDEFDPPFPGFIDFTGRLSELATLTPRWCDALSSVRGIYLLRCETTGEQYVGSAYGEDGFLGRWNGYATTGHGGNKRMLEREESDYIVTILEVSSSTATVDEIIRRESIWKEKLGSREFGMNAN